MTKLFLVTTAAVLSAAASPVVAREARPAAAPTAETAQAAEAPRAASPAQKYCVVNVVTGSRIEHKTCKTRDEWLDQGFDPLAKQ